MAAASSSTWQPREPPLRDRVPPLRDRVPPLRDRVPPLLTDLYQFTMAYAYWRAGRHRETAVFELFFRENPFGGGFTLFAGLDDCLRFLRSFRFREDGEELARALISAGGPPGARLPRTLLNSARISLIPSCCATAERAPPRGREAAFPREGFSPVRGGRSASGSSLMLKFTAKGC